jgi:pyruvate,water dikinase
LKLRYLEFKYLLRANNEVLTTIAEIEERLTRSPAATSIDFIRSRYVAASMRVYKMIGHLNNISGGAFPGLYGAFERIQAQIEEALKREWRPEDLALVLSLDDVHENLIDLTGSKAGNLALVKRLGLPARSGFVITATAFRHLMTSTRLGEDVIRELMFLEDLSYSSLVEMSRRLAARMAETPLPPDLEAAINEAVQTLSGQADGPIRFSVRSSAIGEDSDVSFAGQYRTVLNVPPGEVIQAYLQVVASLYEPQAVVYRRQIGWRDEDAEMAVLVLIMLDPVVSGVMYTRDPRFAGDGPTLINAVFGLGRGLVEGTLTPDEYRVGRNGTPKLIGMNTAVKNIRVVSSETGLVEEPLPEDLRARPTLTAGQAEALARLGLELETGFGEPQDVEWSLLEDGRFVILQSRPLVKTETPQAGAQKTVLDAALVLSGGQSARLGAGAGPAYLVRREEDLDAFPEGAVLVARKSSPVYGCVLNRAAAVVTEVGGATGHMASLAREYGVPALVGAAGALDLIRPGEEITVDATYRRVYRGRLESVLQRETKTARKTRTASHKRPSHPVAQLMTPLNLTNSRSPNFTPEQCRTYHDLIRYIHEKSFSEMFRLGDQIGLEAKNEAKKLAHALPFELWIIDLGGGFADVQGLEVRVEDILSVPACSLLEGLLDPNIHWYKPRPVSLRGMFSVFSGTMINMNPSSIDREFGQKAFAIVSEKYLNFNSRVGYHFAALDSVCGPILNDNYISFCFHGGAATDERRTYRAEMISEILSRRGFDVTQDNDFVRAFIKKFDQEATGRLLADLGRLVLFTRQMDMLTRDRRMVAWLIKAFEEGNYNIENQTAQPAGESPSATFDNI